MPFDTEVEIEPVPAASLVRSRRDQLFEQGRLAAAWASQDQQVSALHGDLAEQFRGGPGGGDFRLPGPLIDRQHLTAHGNSRRVRLWIKAVDVGPVSVQIDEGVHETVVGHDSAVCAQMFREPVAAFLLEDQKARDFGEPRLQRLSVGDFKDRGQVVGGPAEKQFDVFAA